MNKRGKFDFDDGQIHIRYEDEDDVMEIRPVAWEFVIKEKDSGDEYSTEFDFLEDAKTAMQEEIEAEDRDREKIYDGKNVEDKPDKEKTNKLVEELWAERTAAISDNK